MNVASAMYSLSECVTSLKGGVTATRRLGFPDKMTIVGLKFSRFNTKLSENPTEYVDFELRATDQAVTISLSAVNALYIIERRRRSAERRAIIGYNIAICR